MLFGEDVWLEDRFLLSEEEEAVEFDFWWVRFFDAAESSSSSILANSASMLAGNVGDSKGGSKFTRAGGTFSGATLIAGGCSSFNRGGGEWRIFFAGEGVSTLELWFTGGNASAGLNVAVSTARYNTVEGGIASRCESLPLVPTLGRRL